MATAIVYGGPFPAVTAPDGTVFPRGVPVPVPEEVAASLLLQDFSPAGASTPAPKALSGPAEAPAIQAPATAVSDASAADSEAVLAPSTGVS